MSYKQLMYNLAKIQKAQWALRAEHLEEAAQIASLAQTHASPTAGSGKGPASSPINVMSRYDHESYNRGVRAAVSVIREAARQAQDDLPQEEVDARL